MTAQEKAAGVLDTPATAQESKRTQILEPQAMDRKEFDTLRARFGSWMSPLTRGDYPIPTLPQSANPCRCFAPPNPLSHRILSHQIDPLVARQFPPLARRQ